LEKNFNVSFKVFSKIFEEKQASDKMEISFEIF